MLSRVHEQDVFPGLSVEFAEQCSGDRGVPPGASIIAFPLWPKPHDLANGGCGEGDVTAAWLTAHWTALYEPPSSADTPASDVDTTSAV